MQKIILIAFLIYCSNCFAEQQEFTVSPNEPWNDISEIKEDADPGILSQVLLYIPNRFLDLIDIFKADLGVGPAAGAVIRLTDNAQIGARTMLPASLRAGLMGRKFPVVIESDGELAFGSSSTDRLVCSAELGAGVDLLIAGAYIGFCPDEFIDFISGIFFIDIKDDDL